jgi:peptide/nickel transport system substrate-binding protein
VFPVIAGLLATACGGGDDDEAESPDVTEEVTGGGTETATETGAVTTEAPATEDEPDEETSAPVETDAPIVATIAPESSEVEAQPGGTLRYGLDADVDGINPAASALSAPGLTMGNAVFDTLAAILPDGSTVPYLAESFTPSDDFVHWTMKLREGIVFHDGEPLNADAVIANFESQRGHPLVGLAVKPFFPETDAVTKVDDLTVTFNLLEPNAYFPATVAGQLGMTASPAWLEAAIADPSLNQQPVGTGPFRFDTRSQDSVTRFVRNDDWWGGEVYLDAIEFYPVPDAATRVDLLLGGELDGLMTNDPESIQVLDTDGVESVLDETGEEQFAMINSAQPPFDDVRARKALALATPLQDYLDLIGLGISTPANQRFIPSSPFYNPDVVQEGDRPDEALALVAEYCAERGGEENAILGTTTCSDGKINMELQWSGPSVIQTRIHELLSESWSAAGFNITFNELLEDEHIQQTALGQYNVNTWRQFGADDPSTDNVWLLCRTVGGISLNWPRFCDEERDALLLQAQATTDQAERVALYQQVEQMIHDAYTYIFLRHTLWDNAFVDTVHGVCERLGPDGDPLKCASNGRVWFSTVWME